MSIVDRNTQTLFDVRLNRWFGWDGQGDSLWAQSIRPILDPREMNASASHIAGLLRNDAAMALAYRTAFARQPSGIDAETLLVDAAKALAAFQETLVSPRTAFDDFRDALDRGDRTAAARYPASAQRGLSIFVGCGKCDVCHTGPAFTSGEFHDAGVPYFIEPGRVDPGRHGGIAKLKANPYNLLGRYNDDPRRANGWATKHVVSLHRNFGEFKVPSLRGLVHSAPYMHNGSLATLEEVVRHYSEIDIERLHADGERVLRPLHLSDSEIADVVSFLRTLSK